MENVVNTEYIQGRVTIRPITVNVTGRNQEAFIAETNVGMSAVAATEREAYNAVLRLSERVYNKTGETATSDRLKSR